MINNDTNFIFILFVFQIAAATVDAEPIGILV